MGQCEEQTLSCGAIRTMLFGSGWEKFYVRAVRIEQRLFLWSLHDRLIISKSQRKIEALKRCQHGPWLLIEKEYRAIFQAQRALRRSSPRLNNGLTSHSVADQSIKGCRNGKRNDHKHFLCRDKVLGCYRSYSIAYIFIAFWDAECVTIRKGLTV